MTIRRPRHLPVLAASAQPRGQTARRRTSATGAAQRSRSAMPSCGFFMCGILSFALGALARRQPATSRNRANPSVPQASVCKIAQIAGAGRKLASRATGVEISVPWKARLARLGLPCCRFQCVDSLAAGGVSRAHEGSTARTHDHGGHRAGCRRGPGPSRRSPRIPRARQESATWPRATRSRPCAVHESLGRSARCGRATLALPRFGARSDGRGPRRHHQHRSGAEPAIGPMPGFLSWIDEVVRSDQRHQLFGRRLRRLNRVCTTPAPPSAAGDDRSALAQRWPDGVAQFPVRRSSEHSGWHSVLSGRVASRRGRIRCRARSGVHRRAGLCASDARGLDATESPLRTETRCSAPADRRDRAELARKNQREYIGIDTSPAPRKTAASQPRSKRCCANPSAAPDRSRLALERRH